MKTDTRRDNARFSGVSWASFTHTRTHTQSPNTWLRVGFEGACATLNFPHEAFGVPVKARLAPLCCAVFPLPWLDFRMCHWTQHRGFFVPITCCHRFLRWDLHVPGSSAMQVKQRHTRTVGWRLGLVVGVWRCQSGKFIHVNESDWKRHTSSCHVMPDSLTNLFACP